MAHIHIFHRSLRLNDNNKFNSTNKRIDQSNYSNIYFTPEQIEPKNNKYFTNGSVQFMIESLHELSNEIKKKKGKLYFFTEIL